MTRASTLILITIIWAAASAAGCGDESAAPITSQNESFEPLLGKKNLVVARVNGAPILAQDLALQMEEGRTRKEALQDLIQLELLVQEARRRGLAGTQEALRTRRRAMVAKVLRSGFADSYSPARVPRDMVELAYRKYVKRYVHAELVRVSHVIATVPEKATQKEHKASLKIARKIHKLVSSTPMDKSKFVGLKDTFDVGDSKVLLHSETLTTQLRGRTVRAFADAAFAMTKEGQISPVVKSRFGYHILRMIKRIPRRNDSFKEAEAEIRVSILEMTRPVAFQRWMNELAKKIPIAVKWDVFEAALGEVKTKAK